jgi:hypothetical protein
MRRRHVWLLVWLVAPLVAGLVAGAILRKVLVPPQRSADLHVGMARPEAEIVLGDQCGWISGRPPGTKDHATYQEGSHWTGFRVTTVEYERENRQAPFRVVSWTTSHTPPDWLEGIGTLR